jgi:signal transduction histidine kinase
VARAVDIAGLQQAIKGKGSAIVLNGTAEINGYVVINNAFNEPILLIRASQYQDIYAQGTAVRNFLLIAIVLLTGAALSCVLFLFDRKVLSRLESLCSELTAITKSHDVTKRMSTTSYDEVQEISVKVNELLDDVADTQRKITDTRLEIEKTRMQSFFLARVSHELRAPIHSVTGMYRLIMKTSTNPAVRGLVRMADSTACGLLTTVNEILDFAKVESGNSLIEKIPFTVRRVAHEAMDSVLGRAEGKEKIRVVLGVDPNVPPEIIGDPTKLKQVIVYLLSNAVKFTHQGSVHLTISCDGSAAEPLLKIEVADTGIGHITRKARNDF